MLGTNTSGQKTTQDWVVEKSNCNVHLCCPAAVGPKQPGFTVTGHVPPGKGSLGQGG